MTQLLRPESEEDLAGMIRAAAGPLWIQGGGTRIAPPPGAEAVLDTTALSGVVLYEPAALSLVVRAGTPLADIAALLAREGQRLPFEPHGAPGSTIGGVVACNVSGPRRLQAGACRDALLGVRFVDGSGTIVKNGGRVMKNVTGYDLVKLMAGAHGTLGVLTELSFKLQPVPPAQVTLALPGLGARAAVAALSAALASPYDPTGAAWLPGRGALIRLEGLAEQVAYRAQRLALALAPHGQAVLLEGESAQQPWDDIARLAPLADRPGDLWQISVRPSQGPEALARLGGEGFLDWGGGLLHVLYPAGQDVRPALAGIAGHARLMRRAAGAPGRAPARFHPEPAPLARLAEGLRARFDPRAILNPGLMNPTQSGLNG